MNLLFAINGGYIPTFLGCMRSVLLHGGASHYEVFILHSDLTDGDEADIRAALPDVGLHFVFVDPAMFDGFSESKRYPRQIYYRIAAPLLEGFPIMDALSNVDFYRSGAVEHPIPANNHIEPFLQENIPGLWTYYCCSQNTDVANRFVAMPAARSRILGVQMYKYNIAGFLHWGYNFYYSQ